MSDAIHTLFVEPWGRFIDLLGGFLPELMAALLLFLAGLAVAWALSRLLRKILQVLGADRFFASVGLNEALGRAGMKEGPTALLSKLLFWLVAFLFATVALSIMDVPAVERLMERFILYLPNILVAVVVLLAGYLLGNFLGRTVLITLVNVGSRPAGFLSRLVQWGIFLLALAMALEQLGIGRQTVLAAFTISFGGVVLALALAFGLGGREIAREWLERWFKDGADDGHPGSHL